MDPKGEKAGTATAVNGADSEEQRSGRFAAAAPAAVPLSQGATTTTKSDEGPEYKDQVRSNTVLIDGSAVRPSPSQSHPSTSYKQVQVQDNGPRVAPNNQDLFAEAQIWEPPGLDPPGTRAAPTGSGHVLPVHELKTTTQDKDEEQSRCMTKRRAVIAAVVLLVLAVLAGVVGGFCGAGNCAGSSGDDDGAASNATATSAPASSTPATAPSESPTAAPSLSTSTSAIVDFINSITKSGGITYPAPMEAPSTEDLAVKWLIEEDTLGLSADSEEDQARLIVRYALLTVWYSTSGSSWLDNRGWLSDADECTWFGIECVQNELVQLDIESNNLNGSIPADIALLQSLTRLSVRGNPDLGGTLPPSIGELQNLEDITASGCGFDGSLPDSIGNLDSIVFISLQGNKFTGSLPDGIGNWSNLNSIWIYDNSFTGSLPNSIGNWASLDGEFNIHRNSFSGTLPDSIGQWTLVNSFTVHVNSFSGTIPESVRNWVEINNAQFQLNQFVGTMPFCSSNSSVFLTDTSVQADCDEVECDCCCSSCCSYLGRSLLQ